MYWSNTCKTEDLFWTPNIFIGLPTVWVKRNLRDYLLLSIHLTLDQTKEEKNIISIKQILTYSLICWLSSQRLRAEFIRRRRTQICLWPDICPSQPLVFHSCVVTEITWRQYCRRSFRGCDHRLTLGLDLDNQSLLTSSPVLGICILPAVPTVGAFLKNEALRDQCVTETIWTEYMTDPPEGLYINF